MEKKEENAIKILEKYNQEHIIKWMNSQNEDIKQEIIRQVNEIDLEELKDLYSKVQKGIVKNNYVISPIQPVIKEKLSEDERSNYTQIGEQIIKNNKYAVVTMAGGQGTRLRA